MNSTVSELIARRAAIELEIHELETVSKARAIATIRQLMAGHGLTLTDLAAVGSATKRVKSGAAHGSKVAANYRDPVSGATWSGRGLSPRWLTAALLPARLLRTL